MTILIEKFIGDKLFIDGFCKHDESKPTDGIAMGSRLLEADTGDIYRFVNETDGWNLSDEGGSGGGLPTPTASDVGKAMMVQPVGGSIIAPMQSCVPDDEGVFAISNFNTSLFTVGTTVIAEWNGEKMVGTVVNQLDNGNMGVAFDNPLYIACEIWIYDGDAYGMGLYVGEGAAPVVTISVSVFDSYGWAETSSTMIINETSDLTLTKTWQEIYDALTSGKLVLLVEGGHDEYGYISSNPIIYATRVGAGFMVQTAMGAEYYANSATDYPIAD